MKRQKMVRTTAAAATGEKEKERNREKKEREHDKTSKFAYFTGRTNGQENDCQVTHTKVKVRPHQFAAWQ